MYGAEPWYNNSDDQFNKWGECAKVKNLTIIDGGAQFDLPSIKDVGFMFNGCKNLTSIDVSNFDTSTVTNMASMFSNCSNLTSIDLSNFNTNKVINMDGMFCNCLSLVEIVGTLDLTSCTNVHKMFKNCYELKGVHLKNVPRTLDFTYIGGTEGVTYIIDNYID